MVRWVRVSRRTLRIRTVGAVASVLTLALAPSGSASQRELAASRPALRAAALVDSARIVDTVRRLSTDSGGAPASRYAERPETRLVYAPLIDSLIGGPPTTVQRPFASARTETTQVNVVRVIPSDPLVTSAGLVLLTAHYDATGRRAPGWDGLQDPAPGADDNASGVACLVEAARCIDSLASAGLALPFEVALVAFAAEEAFGPATGSPLEGSRVFVRGLEEQGLVVLGAINCDMIAFNPDRRKVDLVSNTASTWLADLLEATAALVSPGLQVVRIQNDGSANSDHASFWAFAEDAVMLIENEFPDQSNALYPGNPNYHMESDTAGALNYGMAADITRAAVATVAALAEPPAGPPDLLVDAPHLVVLPRRVFVGDRASVEVRVFNRGGPIAGPAGAARVVLEVREPGGGARTIGEISLDLPIAPWFYKRALFTWEVQGRDEGEATVVARVIASGLAEAGTANNEATKAVTVSRNAIAAVRAVTNPVRLDRAADDLRFEFQAPLRPGVLQDVEAGVYDIHGRRVARHPREGAQDGGNFLLWRNFVLEGDGDLPSGIYLVDVRLLDRATGAEVSKGAGKFVIQH